MDKKEDSRGHILAIPYPSQGHINPLLQFCKRLSTTRPIKSTLALTNFLSTTLPPHSIPGVGINTFSDGHDSVGFAGADTVESYIAAMEVAGRRSVSDLIRRHVAFGCPVTCIVYDSFLTWALDVAKDHGLVAVAFFTQPCTVNYMYHALSRGKWNGDKMEYPVTIPGVVLDQEDMPSYLGVPGSYAAYFELVLNQHSNVDRADCVLFNTFYELENQVVDSLSKHIPILPIGPTLPSAYLDEQCTNDKDYGLHLFNSTSNATIINWLTTKPPNSIVYISFGSMSSLDKDQAEQVAWALKQSEYDFLWVAKEKDRPMLPRGFVEEMSTLGRGLFVEWCSQLQVLANDAIGCFVTHCGWNSTLEGLSLGVPMVCLPQWTDQPTNAKLVQDVWKVGVKACADENGVVRREEIGKCIRGVMQGDKADGIRANVRKWRDLAKQAFARGGSADHNIDVFVSKIAS